MRKTFPQFIDSRYGEGTWKGVAEIFGSNIRYEEKMEAARAFVKGQSGETKNLETMRRWYANYRSLNE